MLFQYFKFAQLIAQKLDAVTVFTGNLDHFGYGGLENHDTYASFGYADFLNVPFLVEPGEDIDLDLKEYNRKSLPFLVSFWFSAPTLVYPPQFGSLPFKPKHVWCLFLQRE